MRDLGVVFDECLTLDAHISNICGRAQFHLRNIGRIRMLLLSEATSQLMTTQNVYFFATRVSR